MEPLRHRNYRSFVLFNCAFAGATMLAAAFMQIYVLKVLLVPRWQANLMWCVVGLGSFFVARFWGRLADRHGHRPILLICVSLKPIIVIVFLFVSQPWGPLILTIAFFFDSMINAGYFIAMTGYKLKMAPRENRPMFVAATLALSGIAGGLAAIAGGYILRSCDGMVWHVAGRTWINYHFIFALSLLARFGCIPMAAAIREPASSTTGTVLTYMCGIWPMRMLLLPAGLLRNRRETT
jgi:MFS family permease